MGLISLILVRSHWWVTGTLPGRSSSSRNRAALGTGLFWENPGTRSPSIHRYIISPSPPTCNSPRKRYLSTPLHRIQIQILSIHPQNILIASLGSARKERPSITISKVLSTPGYPNYVFIVPTYTAQPSQRVSDLFSLK